MPRSATCFGPHPKVEEFGAVEMPWMWFEIPPEPGAEPNPVVQLGRAAIAFEDGGPVGAPAPMLPPGGTSPATAESLARDVLTRAVTGALADELGTGPRTLDGTPEALVEPGARAWAGFVADPAPFPVEAGIPAVPGAHLGPEGCSGEPARLFGGLQPQVVTNSAAAGGCRPIRSRPRRVVTIAGRRRAARALLTGDGAPRSREAGPSLRKSLGDAPNPGAGARGRPRPVRRRPAGRLRPGAPRGRRRRPRPPTGLDRLEAAPPFTAVARLQAEAAGSNAAAGRGMVGGKGNVAAFAARLDPAGLRRTAARRLSGRGSARSHREAGLTPHLRAAPGDARSRDRRARVDAPCDGALEDDAGAWSALEAEAARRAAEACASAGPEGADGEASGAPAGVDRGDPGIDEAAEDGSIDREPIHRRPPRSPAASPAPEARGAPGPPWSRRRRR